jgi:hypothetical protein
MSSQYQPWNSAMVYGENIQVAVGVNCLLVTVVELGLGGRCGVSLRKTPQLRVRSRS